MALLWKVLSPMLFFSLALKFPKKDFGFANQLELRIKHFMGRWMVKVGGDLFKITGPPIELLSTTL